MLQLADTAAAFRGSSLARGEGQGRKRKAYSCFRIVPFDSRIETYAELHILFHYYMLQLRKILVSGLDM